jgi:CspA family cold shock protein
MTSERTYKQLKIADNKTVNKGTVKFFNSDKGFGFISQEEGDDLFFHVTELQSGTTNKGDTVEFEVGEGRKGPMAVNIRESFSI